MNAWGDYSDTVTQIVVGSGLGIEVAEVEWYDLSYSHYGSCNRAGGAVG